MTDVKEAIGVLTKALKDDPVYYMIWQDNIAMAFKDEYSREYSEELSFDETHDLANNAAMKFLDRLIHFQ